MTSRHAAEATYRPKGYGMSASLARARRPFRTKNAITGVVIASFVVGVWAYSISAVKQDVFDDIDEEARVMTAGEKQAKMSIEDEHRANKALGVSPIALSAPLVKKPKPITRRKVPADDVTALQNSAPSLGILATLSQRCPSLVDPYSKTFIYGAPPLHDPGKLGDTTWFGKGEKRI